MFDITEIATLSGSTVEEVRTYLPSLLIAIRSYTNKSFITPVGVKDDIVIDGNNTIKSTVLPFDSMYVGDVIEVLFSDNNKLMYTIKEISDDKMTITTFEKLYDDSGLFIVVKLSFPFPSDVVAEMLKFKKLSASKTGLKTETLDGYSYTVEDLTQQGYPKSIMSQLSYLRQLPGSITREYLRAEYYI